MIMRNSTWQGRYQVPAVMHVQAQLRQGLRCVGYARAALMELNRLQFKKGRACAYLRAFGVEQGAGSPRGQQATLRSV